MLSALIEAARAAGCTKLTSRVFPENAASRGLLQDSALPRSACIAATASSTAQWRDCVIVELLIGRGGAMNRTVVVAALGTAQTLAWASSYYLPAILADPIAQGTGHSRTVVFGIFSGALLLSAVFGPAVGRAIDQRGGRGMLAISNLVLAAGLVLLGLAHGIVLLSVAWFLLGIGMAMGLYEPAFATLTGLYGRAARGPITGITLIAGFASTVGWPLSAFLDAHYGWRDDLLDLGGAAHRHGTAAEPAADTKGAAAAALQDRRRSAAGAALGHADPRFRLRHNRLRDRRHGGASAASARDRRRKRDGRDRRLGACRARAGRRAARSNSARYASCTRWSRRGCRRSCIRSARRHWRCSGRAP